MISRNRYFNTEKTQALTYVKLSNQYLVSNIPNFCTFPLFLELCYCEHSQIFEYLVKWELESVCVGIMCEHLCKCVTFSRVLTTVKSVRFWRYTFYLKD